MKHKTAKEMHRILRIYVNRKCSKKEFCRKHQIAEHTLDYWRRKLSPSACSTSSSNGFVPLEIDLPTVNLEHLAIAYELYFPNGNRLKIPADLPVEILQKLIKTTC